MSIRTHALVTIFSFAIITYGCNSGSGDAPQQAADPTGTVSIALTDDPWEDLSEMILHVTGISMGQLGGGVISVEIDGGPMSVDMLQLQNGAFQMLASNVEVPAGRYEWIRLVIDPSQSHIDIAMTGGRHNMRMDSDAEQGLELHQDFVVDPFEHNDFMIDFDLRSGVQFHEGGMMGSEYRLHSRMRMVEIEESGGLMGEVHSTLIDIYHPDCDDRPGGNWAYLFNGDVLEPDDIADIDSDGAVGPIMADRIDMDTMSGQYLYYFGFLEPGQYRIAITCAGEWDEVTDDDYPADPDGHFGFQLFSEPFDVVRGEMHQHDLGGP